MAIICFALFVQNERLWLGIALAQVTHDRLLQFRNRLDRDSAIEEGVNPDDIDRTVLSIYYRGWLEGLAEIDSGPSDAVEGTKGIRNRVKRWFGL